MNKHGLGRSIRKVRPRREIRFVAREPEESYKAL